MTTAKVPFAGPRALAIYEALRSPDEPGIAQLEFRWDGRRRVQVT